MLKAADLIDVDIRNIDKDNKRIAGILSSLSKESLDTRLRLGNELIEIVLDSSQRAARRAQAAFAAGSSAELFGLKGSERVVALLLKVIDKEFYSKRVNPHTRDLQVMEPRYLDLVLLQGLVFAILFLRNTDRQSIAMVLSRSPPPFDRGRGQRLESWKTPNWRVAASARQRSAEARQGSTRDWKVIDK